jgi:hypothetical protein
VAPNLSTICRLLAAAAAGVEAVAGMAEEEEEALQTACAALLPLRVVVKH